MSLHKEVVGRGHPLVLVHGWALDGAAFRPLIHALSEGWEAHLVDLPGHGRSPALPEDDWVGALAAAAPPGAVWAGWSLGGLLALAAARAARPAGLLLLGSGPRFCRAPDWPHGQPVTALESMIEGVRTEPGRVVKEFLALVASRGNGARQAVRALRQSAAQASPAGLLSGLRLLQALDVRAELGAIEVPARWLTGDADPLWSPAAAVDAAARMPAGCARVLEGEGHALPLTATAVVVDELERLRRQLWSES